MNIQNQNHYNNTEFFLYQNDIFGIIKDGLCAGVFTQLSDIEKELVHYREHFRDKVVFCNCDDPYESNFFKYFALNFNALGLKKLIATCYDGSPIAQQELPLFPVEEGEPKRKAYKVEISEVPDMDGNGATDLTDVKLLLKSSNYNAISELKGNGDFRSPECVELLKQADVVVTNPPFSLFREYVTQLDEYNKNFIIMGNTNTLVCKEVFKMFKADRIRTGYTHFNTGMFFYVPESYEKFHHMEGDRKVARVSTSCWYTNLPVEKHKEFLVLFKHYTPEEFPKYDNYDAINVNTYTDIPCDYEGVMGVPITFLDKFNPNQFEIIWQASGNTYANAPKEILEELKFDPSIKYGGGLGAAVLNGKAVYTRVLIRNKKPQIS